jgi:tetratricopeptide (TPR) repeat protein
MMRIVAADRLRSFNRSVVAISIEMNYEVLKIMYDELDEQWDTPDDARSGPNQPPETASSYYNRGLSRDRIGDREGALADYNCTIQLDPNYAKAYVNRGLLRDRLGDRLGALSDYDRAIEIEDLSATNYYNRANVRYRLDDKQGALVDYDRSIQLDSTYAKAYYNRGIVRASLDDRHGARKDLQTAAELFRQQRKDWDYQSTLEKIQEI